MMKKILSLVLCFSFLILLLSGCQPSETRTEPLPEHIKKIGENYYLLLDFLQIGPLKVTSVMFELSFPSLQELQNTLLSNNFTDGQKNI